MYSHITVGTSKLSRAMKFYDAALAPLGLARTRTFKIAASYAPPDFAGVVHPVHRQALEGDPATLKLLRRNPFPEHLAAGRVEVAARLSSEFTVTAGTPTSEGSMTATWTFSLPAVCAPMNF